MYFTECARLAERHPDLAGTVQQVDEQLARNGADGLIRVADLASFLGADPNQVGAVLEKLAQEKLLLSDEMVECDHCRMAARRAEYQQQLAEDGEYRCTSCDRPLGDRSIRTITAYRRGERWKEGSAPVPTRERGAKIEHRIGPAKSHPRHVRVFRKQGKTWLVVYDGAPTSVGHSIGMTYICRLLQRPGEETHAAVLRGLNSDNGRAPILGSAGNVLDEKALKAYREQLKDLEDEIREAEDYHDVGRAERLKEDYEALTAEIGRATGLGGRSRKAGDERERARQAVSVAVRRALKAIKKEHEPLWQHLNNCLRIGEYLSYEPEGSLTWET